MKRILVLGAFALGVGVAVRMSVAPVPAVAGPPEGGGAARPSPAAIAPAGVDDGRPRWEHVWTRPTPAALSASVSHDGACVAWVDDRGGVRRLDGASGATLWQAPPVPGVDRVLASPKGQVVGYSLLNPAHPTVRVYDSKFGGRKAATLPVRGAVWSAALSGDGSRAVVGTGEGVVHTLPLAKPAPAGPAPKSPSTPAAPVAPMVRAASCRLPGIPESLSLAGERPLAVLGTWNDAGVRLLDLNDLSEHWGSRDPQRDRSYQVRLSADGSTAVGVSARGPRGREARIDAWDTKTGRLLWREEIDGRDALALVSADGSRIAVSYARMSSYRTGGDSLEYKLALFDRDGNRLFGEKGSALFRPRLVALSADGARLTVFGGQGTLYTLDWRGNFLSKLRLETDATTGEAPTVEDTVATPDGRFLLVRRGDDRISLFKAAQ